MSNKLFFKIFTSLAIVLPSLLISTAVSADENYPKKPVSMTVAYSPGGGTDTAARVIAKHIKKHLNQRLVIKNKPGAGGQIGFTAIAKGKNDGYTIGFINVPSILMVKMLRDDVPYEMSDFETIANIQKDPVVLTVQADSPYKTLADLIAAAKANPGKINIAGDGPQSNNQLQVVVAEDKLGIDLNFVSFSGSGPAITATLGNQVDASVPSATAATPHIKEGRLRALAVFSDTPYSYLPDVPTIKVASGVEIPGIGASLRGIAVPKGIDPKKKQILQDAVVAVMKDPEFIEQTDKMGLPLAFMDSKDFSDYLVTAEKDLEAYIGLLKK